MNDTTPQNRSPTGTWTLEPVGVARSPWRDKFGVPRQPGLVDVEAHIDLYAPFSRAEGLVGLERCSHVWVIFGFHQVPRAIGWPTAAGHRSLSVRPPRLGGNRRVGVWASRSTHRPNGLGLSVVRVLGVERIGAGAVRLRVAGADWVDGSPVFDIKPYVPWSDAIPDARTHYADVPPGPRLRVRWWGRAADGLSDDVKRGLEQAIALDPRPAYQQGPDRSPRRWFFLRFGAYEARFCVRPTRPMRASGGLPVTATAEAPPETAWICAVRLDRRGQRRRAP